MAVERHQLLRLQRVEVDGLFGVYDHRIDLKLTDHITLLHGQNGVGKTTVLQMINALLQGDIAYFSRVPFTRFFLVFQGGSNLELMPNNTNSKNNTATLTLTTESGNRKSENVEIPPSAEFLAKRTGFLEPHGGTENAWIDIRDGEVLTEMEIFSRYGGQRNEYPHQEKIPWLDEFLRHANVHLIKADRLVRTPSGATPEGSFDPRYRYRDYSYPILLSSVVECSRDLKNQLDLKMAAYGRQAQALDQSFPQRLIAIPDEPAVQEILTRMIALSDKTESYKRTGILDEAAAHPFDIDSLRDLDDTQARVMALYVQDTEHKLSVLDDLASRTRHLLDNVNRKFRHKKIHLDREEGLVAQGKKDQSIPLRSLSSGEQHELVLYYELLFKTRPNTVVLIDEPEISLHVAWQKNFLSDLMEIVRISGFDAVVATHSPYIVGDRDDLMVGLDDPN